MHEQSNIPTVRNLDGVYYRVVRDGNHVSRCFSDLSESEQDVIMEKYDAEQLRRLCRCLCISLRQIGDALDLVGDECKENRMETENQSSFILPMPQDFPSGIADEDTVIPFIEDTVTPMTIDSSAPGDVIELRDDFDFDGYQVVRREFFAHTFEPSITFNNYKVYVNAACLNKFPHADCVQLLINRESRILALRPCTEFERDAFAWCNTSGGKRKPRQVTGKFFFAKLFELMDWNIDYRYKLLGKVIHANDEYLIAFDLNASEIYQRIAKDGGKPKTARTPVFPAGWKDQFGLPYHEHQKSLQINIFDGHAIYGIKDNTVSSIASGEAATPIPGTHRPEVPVQEEIKNG